ncbi:uncharacterized protein LOC128748801 isoform X1 [Synchiropus splendidus]|uniref:uncharacterized protein LOC128748801 isoform X1 n=1 Tax=Synchiropus splendidus TaxID=270530 RepID=UPI00237D44FB|nr:uncharacterized protein LOC128748801 isoform X1 [Synchiropus splendidus]
MDERHSVICLLLGLWLYAKRRSEESRERLRAARQNTLAKYRRVWETILQYEAEERRRRRRRRMWLSLNDTAPTRRSGRITETLKWWDVVVPGFTNEEWLQNFRMAEETSCARKCVQQWRDDTPLSACVCRSRREWLLLCGSLLLARSTRILESALESASLLCSGVCWSFVLRQRRCWCQSKSVFQVKPGSEILPGTLRTHGGSHTAIDSFRIPITTPHDCLDSL